jgi:Flp pilus assembly protein TadD
LHDNGHLDEAAQVLRTTLHRFPDSTIVLNNLAQTLSDQGRNSEALALIRRADEARSPFGNEVRATRTLIEERMKARAGS